VGVIGAAGNGLFGLAAERGFLSIVSVLVALYPVTTILLAHLVLRERLTAIQRTGVLVALGGVSLAVTG
jgi:drug/metabolite transporter (DMT)-like permease